MVLLLPSEPERSLHDDFEMLVFTVTCTCVHSLTGGEKKASRNVRMLLKLGSLTLQRKKKKITFKTVKMGHLFHTSWKSLIMSVLTLLLYLSTNTPCLSKYREHQGRYK